MTPRLQRGDRWFESGGAQRGDENQRGAGWGARPEERGLLSRDGVPQEGESRPLVDPDLLPGGERLAGLPALRLPLAEEVDGHFRSALEFHFPAEQRTE